MCRCLDGDEQAVFLAGRGIGLISIPERYSLYAFRSENVRLVILRHDLKEEEPTYAITVALMVPSDE